NFGVAGKLGRHAPRDARSVSLRRVGEAVDDPLDACDGRRPGRALEGVDAVTDEAGDEVEVRSPGRRRELLREDLVDGLDGVVVARVDESLPDEVLRGPADARRPAEEHPREGLLPGRLEGALEERARGLTTEGDDPRAGEVAHRERVSGPAG